MMLLWYQNINAINIQVVGNQAKILSDGYSLMLIINTFKNIDTIRFCHTDAIWRHVTPQNSVNIG